MPPKFVKVPQVVEATGLSYTTLLRGLRAGRIPGVQICPRGTWLVDASYLDRLEAEARNGPTETQAVPKVADAIALARAAVRRHVDGGAS